jgi:aminoglycoside phosphotransferase (APT) family kinase protein
VHPDQLDVDDDLARRLIRERFPDFAELPVERAATAGTVNAIFRIGDKLAARFPLAAATEVELQSEADALMELASHSSVPVPRPVGVGAADADYPSAWSVQTWLPGEPASADGFAAAEAVAEDLVALLGGLRSASTGGREFDGRGRGGDLPDHDEWLAQCFERSAHLMDVEHAAVVWAALRELPRAGADVMSHRDLTPMNLLVAEVDGVSRLAGVLDGGSFGPADPALDLVVAWHLFDRPAREVIRRGVGASRVEWLRGAAWAMQQAMGLGWYYEESNPEMSVLGLSTMRRLLADPEVAALGR